MDEFPGTTLQEVVKNLILSFSGLGLGVAVYVAIHDFQQARKTSSYVRRLWAARTLFSTSFIIIVGLIAEAIYRSHAPIQVEWRTLVYTAAIIGAAFGGLGIAYESGKVDDKVRPFRVTRRTRGEEDPRDMRDPRRASDPRDKRDPRLPGDPPE